MPDTRSVKSKADEGEQNCESINHIFNSVRSRKSCEEAKKGILCNSFETSGANNSTGA